MAEDTYIVDGYDSSDGHWKDVCIQFPEDDSEIRCLCTFPDNDFVTDIDRERVQSLALLGAAVVLAHRGDFSFEGGNFLPHCIPDWIVDRIKEVIIDKKD